MKFSFLEKPQFTKRIVKSVSEDDYFALQDFLLEQPEWGDVVPGLPRRLRKIRWAAAGRGKRGGLRIIHYLAATGDFIVFLDVWAKNEKADLSFDEYRKLCDFLEESGF